MSFNPEPTKQAQEVIFSKKTIKKIYPKLFFNNFPVSKFDSQKHLRLHLDSKLSLDIHIKTILTKVNGNIGLLRKFHSYYLQYWTKYIRTRNFWERELFGKFLYKKMMLLVMFKPVPTILSKTVWNLHFFERQYLTNSFTSYLDILTLEPHLNYIQALNFKFWKILNGGITCEILVKCLVAYEAHQLKVLFTLIFCWFSVFSSTENLL